MSVIGQTFPLSDAGHRQDPGGYQMYSSMQSFNQMGSAYYPQTEMPYDQSGFQTSPWNTTAQGNFTYQRTSSSSSGQGASRSQRTSIGTHSGKSGRERSVPQASQSQDSFSYLPPKSTTSHRLPAQVSQQGPLNYASGPTSSHEYPSNLYSYSSVPYQQTQGEPSNYAMRSPEGIPYQSTRSTSGMQTSSNTMGRGTSTSSSMSPQLPIIAHSMPNTPSMQHIPGQQILLPAEPIRVVTPRPKPQCWDHGCNGRQFSTFSNLLRHQREKAGTANKSVCPHCGLEFTRTTARNGHLTGGKCKGRPDVRR